MEAPSSQSLETSWQDSEALANDGQTNPAGLGVSKGSLLGQLSKVRVRPLKCNPFRYTFT